MNIRNKTHTAFILNALIIAALVLSGVSPACKFISGETMLVEICKSDGSVETVELNYAANGEEPTPSEPNQKINNDCAFCFADSNIKAAAIDTPQFQTRLDGQTGLIKTSNVIAIRTAFYLYEARGPPTFSV